jgi:hypothetical protein
VIWKPSLSKDRCLYPQLVSQSLVGVSNTSGSRSLEKMRYERRMSQTLFSTLGQTVGMSETFVEDMRTPWFGPSLRTLSRRVFVSPTETRDWYHC